MSSELNSEKVMEGDSRV